MGTTGLSEVKAADDVDNAVSFLQILAGPDIASATTIVLSGSQQYFHLTGVTTGDFISLTDGAGDPVLHGREFEFLIPTGLTLRNNVASPPGGTVPMVLAAGINHTYAAGTRVRFKYDSALGVAKEMGHHPSPITAGTYGAFQFTGITVSVDAFGHVLAISEHTVPWVQSFSIRVASLGSDSYFLGNPGQGQALTYSPDGPTYPAPWACSNHHVRLVFQDLVFAGATLVEVRLINNTAGTSALIGNVTATGVLDNTVNLAFVLNDELALQFSPDNSGTQLSASGTIRSMA